MDPAPVEVGSLSHYLQGFVHPRWLFGIRNGKELEDPEKRVEELIDTHVQ